MFAGDTIYALASGPGRAAVAVVRVSGPAASVTLTRLAGMSPPPRQARLAMLRDPRDGGEIDQALVLWFPGPGSFTGEDVAEFQIHGGPAVIEALAGALETIDRVRPAEPGEFSRRAFRNGKLDLAEAEGLADLIAADTAVARRQAVWRLRGGLSAIYERWRADLVDAMALAEASLDFSDEEVPDDLDESAAARVRALREEMAAALKVHPVNERLHDGLRIVLIGAPNVGKSSLLNALARREAAIVTDVPGTTRDVIEVKLDLGGYPATLSDTAGLRDAVDAIEAEGVNRARAAAAAADLVIDVRDATAGLSPDGAIDDAAITFWNKADLAPPPVAGALFGSAVTGAGLEALEMALTQAAKQAMDAGAPAIARARHRVALTDAVDALDRAERAMAPELAAEDMRIAAAALGRVTGFVDVEDVLDQVFGAFCIGK